MITALLTIAPTRAAHARTHAPKPASTPITVVISFTVIRADEALPAIEKFYPRVHVAVDRNANALIVSGTPDEVAGIRAVCGGIDAKNALAPVTQSITLHRIDANDLLARLRSLYADAKFSAVGRHILIISANGTELQQVQSLVAAVDAPPATPTPAPSPTFPATEAVHIFQAPVREVAREVAGAVHGLRIGVAGQAIVLAGSPDLIARAKDVITVLDAPAPTQRYTAVYRIHTLDAQSVGDLIQKSFPDVRVSVDEDINSISVLATESEQQRIADAVARLDTNGAAPNGASGAASGSSVDTGAGSAQIYTLKAALPGGNGAPSTSANDIATLVTQALQPQAPDLRINVSPDSPQLILTGNPYSIKLAKDLLSQLDVSQKLVVLDTEILELDENTAKNLGVAVSSFNGGPLSLGTIFSESSPAPDPNTGIVPGLKRFQALYRTPIAFGVAINLAIEHGNARVLADPRITTLSGHTATIRAGDNISIPLTTGGGAGTIATTQIQTFQTGVTLDITPVVNADGLITVALHPVVNSLTGILNGVPQISTRDTQTTVALREDQTLVIGGLIQDNTQRTESKVPVLGDLPLVGRVFRNQTLNGDRNELIISVTPHILTPGETTVYPGPPLPHVPTPAPLPTLPPGTVLPAAAPTFEPTSMPSPPPLILSTPAPSSAVATPGMTPTTTPSTSPSGSMPNQTDAFTYQASPNAAVTTNAPRILFVQFFPTSVAYGQPINIVALTTSNVSALSLTYNTISLSLAPTSPGRWQATVPFTLSVDPTFSGPITINLVAKTVAGLETSVPIPVTVIAPSGSRTEKVQ